MAELFALGLVQMRRYLMFVVVALLSGCATSGTLAEPSTRNKVYSGTIRHFELKCAHAVCLDFPFSLVADTVLLPITIPWSIYNVVAKDPDVESPCGPTIRCKRVVGLPPGCLDEGLVARSATE